MATVDSLDSQISVSVNQANRALERLNSQLNTLGAGFKSTGILVNTGLSKITKSSMKISESFKVVNKCADELAGGLKRVTRQFVSMGAVVKKEKISVILLFLLILCFNILSFLFLIIYFLQ